MDSSDMVNIVLTGRNDYHGGTRFSDKLIEILDWNVRLFQKYNLEHTFWFVEWGKEEGSEWLSPVLVERYQTCRCIMVPNEAMSRLYHEDLVTENDQEIIPFIIYDEDVIAPPIGQLL